MKKTELATIIFVASLSMMATYFIASSFIDKDKALSRTVKTAERLPDNPSTTDDSDESVPLLSKQFFNEDALNPTVEVYVESDNESANTLDNSLSNSKPTDADDESDTEPTDSQPNNNDATTENEQQ